MTSAAPFVRLKLLLNMDETQFILPGPGPGPFYCLENNLKSMHKCCGKSESLPLVSNISKCDPLWTKTFRHHLATSVLSMILTICHMVQRGMQLLSASYIKHINPITILLSAPLPAPNSDIESKSIIALACLSDDL